MKPSGLRKGISLLCAIALCFTLLGSDVAAAAPSFTIGKSYKVKVSSTLNVRSAPSTKASIIGSLARDAVVTVVEVVSPFCKIRASTGFTGYVSGEYLVAYSGSSPTPTPKDGAKIYKVTASSLKLRAGAGSNYSVIQLISKGTQVTLVDTNSAPWFRVKLSNGLIGYASSQYLAYYTTVGGTTATPTPANTPKPTTAPTTAPTTDKIGLGPGKIYKVSGSSVYLRKSASTSAASIRTLKKDTLVTFIESAASPFYKVRTEDGVIGFMSSSYLVYVKTLSDNEPPKAIVDDTKQKYTYEEMMHDINELVSKYPSMAKRYTLATTYLGKEIVAVRVGNPNASKSIMVNGAIHAREYMTTILVMKQMEYYLTHPDEKYNGQQFSSILDSCNIWFVPMVNPDGVMISQSGVSSLSSSKRSAITKINKGSTNFTRWKANALGVDINRNFSAGWYTRKDVPGPASEMYPGTKHSTEIETKALINLVNDTNINATINYHSIGSFIYWRYDQSGSQLSRDGAIANDLSYVTGYRLEGAPTTLNSGGFMDYMISVKKKPSFTIEIGPSGINAPQSQSYFSAIWNRNKLTGIYLAWKMQS